MTYAEFVDDVLVTLGMVHDDALRYRDNILQNTLHALTKLGYQDLKGDTGKTSDGRAASGELSVAVVPLTYIEQPTDIEWAHLYFNLPSEVYELPNDKGINFIRYHRPSLPVNCPPSIAGASFTVVTLAQLTGIYGHRWLTPQPNRPFAARYKNGNVDKVCLFGVSPLVTKVIVGFFAVPNYMEVDYADDMPIQPDRFFDLKRMVMAMEFWPMTIPQERLKNDGRDLEPGEVIRPANPISVNDPAMVSKQPEQ